MEKENNVLELEKSNKTGFVLMFLGILLIIGGAVYCYINYFNNPSYIVKKGFNKIANIYNENYSYSNQNFKKKNTKQSSTPTQQIQHQTFTSKSIALASTTTYSSG